LRIAFCHYTSDIFGGSDRSLFDLVTHLPRASFSPLMILKTGDPMAERYVGAGIPVVQKRLVSPRKSLELGKLGAYALSFGPSVIAVARAIMKFNADIVHVNTLYNQIGGMAGCLAGRPVVWHVREMGQDSRAGRLMLRGVAAMATRAVAISGAVGKTLQACGPRLRVVPNGIDLSEYDALPSREAARAALGLDAGQPVISTIGRLEPWKGQHVFVEAIPAVAAKHPRALFLIVGGAAVNKPEYETALKERCAELGVADRVVFTGIRKDIPLVLAASDALVLPSATSEPFGRTVVEAMAAGCPVIATAAGGPLEIVVDGVTGFLVPPNDAQALGAKMHSLLSDPSRAREMGGSGRERAHQRYSLERLVEDMAGLFEEVGAERGIQGIP
jgi:glycosyltransferase involved in cell wall biosynthesis